MCDFHMFIRLLLVFAIVITDVLSVGERSSDHGYGSVARGENRQSSQNTPRWSQFFVMNAPRTQSADKRRGFFYEVGDQPSEENKLLSSSSVNNQQPSNHYQLLDDGSRIELNRHSTFDEINKGRLRPAAETKPHIRSSQVHIPLPEKRPFIKTEEASVQPEYSHETASHIGQAIQKKPRSQLSNNPSISTGSFEPEHSRDFREDQIPRNADEKYPERNQENLPDRQRRRRQRRPSSRTQSHTTAINTRNRNRRPLAARERSLATPYPPNSTELQNVHGALIKNDTNQSLQQFQKLSVARQIHNGRTSNTNRRRNQPVLSSEEQVPAPQKLISDNRSMSPASHTIRLNRRRPFNPRRTTERNQVLEKNTDNFHSEKYSPSAVKPQWDEDHHNQTTSVQRTKPNDTRYGKRMPIQSHAIPIRRQGNRRPRLNRRKNSTNIEFPDSSQIQNTPGRDRGSEDNTPAQTEIVPKLEMESLGSHVHMSIPEIPFGDNTHRPFLRTAFGIRLKASNSTELHVNGKKDHSYLGSQESEISVTKQEHSPDTDTNRSQEEISTIGTNNQILRTSDMDDNERPLSIASLITQYDDESAEEKVHDRVSPSSRIREMNEDDFVLVPPTVIEEEKDIKPFRLPKFYPTNYNLPRAQDNVRNQNKFFNTEAGINPTYKNEQHEQSRRNFGPDSNDQSINVPSHSYDIYPQRFQPKLSPSRNLHSSFAHEGSFAKHKMPNEPIVKYDSKNLVGSQILSEITTTVSSLESGKAHGTKIIKRISKNPENEDLPLKPANQQMPKVLTSHQTNVLSGPSIQHGFVHTQLQLPPLNFRFHLTPVQGNTNASLVSGTYQNQNFQAGHMMPNNHYQPPIPYQHAPIFSGHTVSNNHHHSGVYNHPFQYQPPVSPYQTLRSSRQPVHASHHNAREMHYQAENLGSNNAKQSERGPNVNFHGNPQSYPQHLAPLNNEKIPGTLRSFNTNENPLPVGNTNQFQVVPDINTPWQPAGTNTDLNSPYITLYLRNLNPVFHNQPQSTENPILKVVENKITSNETSTLQIRKRLDKISSNENSAQNATSHQHNNTLSVTPEQSSTVSNSKPTSTDQDQTKSTHSDQILVVKPDRIISINDGLPPTVKNLMNEEILNKQSQNSSRPQKPILEKRKEVDQTSAIFQLINATSPSVIDATSTDPTEIFNRNSIFSETESDFPDINQDLKNEQMGTSSTSWMNNITKEFEFTVSLITNSTEIPDSTTASPSGSTTRFEFTIANVTIPPSDNSLTTVKLSTSNTTNTLQTSVPESIPPLTKEMKTILSFLVSSGKSVLQPTTPGVSYGDGSFSNEDVSQLPSNIESNVSLSNNDVDFRTLAASLNQNTTLSHEEQITHSTISTQNPDVIFDTSSIRTKEISKVTTASILDNLTNVTTIKDTSITLQNVASEVPSLEDSNSKLINNVSDSGSILIDREMNTGISTAIVIATESSAVIPNFNESQITNIETRTEELDDQNNSVNTLDELSDVETLTTKQSETSSIDLNRQTILSNPTVMDFSKITNSPTQPKKITIQRVGSLKIPSDASVFMFTELPYNKNVFLSPGTNSGIRQIHDRKSDDGSNDISHDEKSLKIPFDNETTLSNDTKAMPSSNSTIITNGKQAINTSENLLKPEEPIENNISRFTNISSEEIFTVSDIKIEAEPSIPQPTNKKTFSTEFDASNLTVKVDDMNERFNITESPLDIKTQEPKPLAENSNVSFQTLEEMATTEVSSSQSDFIITVSTISNLAGNSSVTSFVIANENKSNESNTLDTAKQLSAANLISEANDTLEKEITSVTETTEPAKLNEGNNKINTRKINEPPCDTTPQSSMTTNSKNAKGNDEDLKVSTNDLEGPRARPNEENSETAVVNNNSKVLVDQLNSSSTKINKSEEASARHRNTNSFSTTEENPLLTKIEPQRLASLTLTEEVNVEAPASLQNLTEISVQKDDISEVIEETKELKPTANDVRDIAVQDSHEIKFATTIPPTEKLVPFNSDCGSIKESDSQKAPISKVNSDKTLIIALDKTS